MRKCHCPKAMTFLFDRAVPTGGICKARRGYNFTVQEKRTLSRVLLVFALLALLCAGPFAPPMNQVQARPDKAADKVSVVISEFRTRGQGGADDEFIEIYNATGGI